MPTPFYDDYVELVGTVGATVTTLLLGSRAIFCRDWTGLLSVGRSRGENLTVYGADGTTPFDRERDELAVQLRGVVVDGNWDEDNVAAVSPRPNALTLMRKVANFFDDNCTGRECTVRLTENSGDVWEAAAHFEEIDDWRILSPVAVETNLLVTVYDGVLTKVVA